MRVAPTLAMMLIALASAGCQREMQATSDDVTASMTQAGDERRRLQAEIHRWAVENGHEAYHLRADTQDFLGQRREAWWALEREAAWQVTDEWAQISRLARDAADAYGYELRNFPRAGNEAVAFMKSGEESWIRLVQDCGTFVEWREREGAPLRKELREFYQRAGWETANLRLDVQDFLAWRHREYHRLQRQIHNLLADESQTWDRLGRDVDDFVRRSGSEGHRLVVDLRHAAAGEAAQVPRLVDDLGSWASGASLGALGRDVRRSVQASADELHRLMADLNDLGRQEQFRMARLRAEVADFFRVYEREVRPLSAEVKQFWSDEIAKGHLAIRDLQRFFTHSADECWALEQDIRTFIVDGKGEWQALRARIREFIWFDKAAFGHGARPITHGNDGPVFGDYALPPGFEP